MNPAAEYVRALLYPGEEHFSPKHLATFAVEALSDPHVKIKGLSIMIAYVLVLVADKATWPGQRERIRKRLAQAVGRIPEVKFQYGLHNALGERDELRFYAQSNSENILAECRKVDDLLFERAVRRVLKQRLKEIMKMPEPQK